MATFSGDVQYSQNGTGKPTPAICMYNIFIYLLGYTLALLNLTWSSRALLLTVDIMGDSHDGYWWMMRIIPDVSEYNPLFETINMNIAMGLINHIGEY